jgi:hypothetical protein
VTWATWWLGDLAGLLIATPIVLTLIGRPRSEWAPRRVPVGLTMTLVVAFLGLGIVQASRWNSDRLNASFAHDASGASLILASQLEEPLRALEAMRGVFTVVRHVPRADLRLATQRWLDSGAVSAMGWSERSAATTSPPSRRASAPKGRAATASSTAPTPSHRSKAWPARPPARRAGSTAAT